jgi:hypothetical protein
MIATLLACLAVTCLVTAWMAHRKGDADRDVKLMLGMRGVLGGACALAV